MPIYQQKNVSEFIKIAIWKITETEEELSESLVNNGFSADVKPNIINKTKIKQWLATRILLSNFFKDAQIIYDQHGKPSINNGWHISISHSNEFVAIIINKNESCGIDIERISTKVERIKHKFLNPLDLQNVTSPESLTLYWGAKEALYKYYGKKEVLFIENLFIENYSEKKDSFTGRIDIDNFKKEIPMEWEKVEDYVLVYTL